MRFTVALAIAVVLGFVTVVRAEPLDLMQIPADAKWAAHLDVDALVVSSLAKKAHQQMLKEHPEAEGHLAAFRKMWNFDPSKDLHAITIYGWQLKKDTGVAIIHAKVDQKQLLEKAKQRGTPRTHVRQARAAQLASRQRLSARAIHDRHLLQTRRVSLWRIGRGGDHALDVLDGAKPNFSAKYGSSSTAHVPPEAILVAGIHDLSGAKLPHECPLAKQVDFAGVAIGEHQGHVFVGGELTAKTATVTQQMKAVADGALAFASLMHGNDADLAKLISAAKVSVAAKTVSVEWSGPVDVAWNQLQKAVAKFKAMHKDWGHHGMPDGCPLQNTAAPCKRRSRPHVAAAPWT